MLIYFNGCKVKVILNGLSYNLHINSDSAFSTSTLGTGLLGKMVLGK